jgi:hypothetical protein
MAVSAKAGIQQRFTRDDVRCPFRTDRERNSVTGEGNRGLPQSSHGTSVLASKGCKAAGSVVSKFAYDEEGAGAPAPGYSGRNGPFQMW